MSSIEGEVIAKDVLHAASRKVGGRATPSKKKELHPAMKAKQFKPGVCPNPYGRGGNPSGKISLQIREQLRRDGGKSARRVAEVLIEIAVDKTHPQCVRAQEVLIERSEGKVPLHMEHGGSIGLHRIELVGLTPEELERAADLAAIPEVTGEEPEEGQEESA